VKTLTVTEKTGDLISIQQVSDDDQLMIINKSGIAIRMDVNEMRVMGRATQGVKLINLKGKDEIAAVAKIALEHLENENNASFEEETNDESESSEKPESHDETEAGEDSEDSGKAFDEEDNDE
jgi:DNA gyrase subunit A